jgi:hypothetical protein
MDDDDKIHAAAVAAAAAAYNQQKLKEQQQLLQQYQQYFAAVQWQQSMIAYAQQIQTTTRTTTGGPMHQIATLPMQVPVAPTPNPQQPVSHVPLTIVWNVPGGGSGGGGGGGGGSHPFQSRQSYSEESRGGGRGGGGGGGGGRGRGGRGFIQRTQSHKRDATFLSTNPSSLNYSPSNKSSRHSRDDVPTSSVSISSASDVMAPRSEIVDEDDNKEFEEKIEKEGGIGGGGPDADFSSLIKLIPPKYRTASQVGNSAAEIEKWRAARRRHFPTESVVAAKVAAQASANERGELLLKQNTGKMRLPNHSSVTTAVVPVQRENGGDSLINSVADEGPEEFGVTRDSALDAIEVDNKAAANAAAREEEEENDVDEKEGGRKEGRHGLGACIRFLKGQCQRGPLCHYPHGLNGTYTPEQILNHKKPCRFYLLGKCRMDKLCPFQHTGSGVSKKKSGEDAHSGLLSKLLKSEVEAETSLLLQCIRYVVSSETS